MKTKLLLTLSLALVFVVNSQAITISNFGTGPATGGTWTYSGGAFSGSSDAGDFLFESLGSTVDISGNTQLQLLLGVTTVTAGTSFTIRLQESLGGTDVASATFDSTQLGSGNAIAALTNLGGSFSNVNAWVLEAGGASGDSFDVNLTQLNAVPEPSTVLLLGLSGGLLCLLRRRK